MTQIKMIARRSLPQVIEGTKEEITEQLKTVESEKRLTLIIPGDEVESNEVSEIDESSPASEKTFQEILSSSQLGFDQTGMTDDELSEFLEAEVKAYRAERRAKRERGV
jgi:hypothetical protein